MDDIRICDVVYRYVDGRSVPAGGPAKTPGISTSVVFDDDDDDGTASSSIMRHLRYDDGGS